MTPPETAPAPTEPIQACATCGYALAGLTTPTCPECGCDTIEAARLRELRRAKRIRVSRHWLLVCAGFVFCLAFLVITRSPNQSEDFALPMGLSAPLLFRWLWHGRSQPNLINFATLLLVGPLLGSSAIWLWCQPPAGNAVSWYAATWQAYVGLHMGLLAMILIGWIMEPKRRLWSMTFSTGLLCFLGATFAGAQAQWDVLHGRSWSVFDTAAAHALARYPLRSDQVVSMSLPHALLGVVMMTAALGLRRAKRKC